MLLTNLTGLMNILPTNFMLNVITKHTLILYRCTKDIYSQSKNQTNFSRMPIRSYRYYKIILLNSFKINKSFYKEKKNFSTITKFIVINVLKNQRFHENLQISKSLILNARSFKMMQTYYFRKPFHTSHNMSFKFKTRGQENFIDADHFPTYENSFNTRSSISVLLQSTPHITNRCFTYF